MRSVNRLSIACFILFTLALLFSCNNDSVTPPAAQRGAATPEELTLRLQEAFAQKNAQLLAPLLADTVSDGSPDGGARCGDGGCTPDSFIYRRTVETDHLWTGFDQAVQYGFRSNGKNVLTAPWYEDERPEGDYVFIAGKNVNIRAAPGKKSAIIGQKSDEMIEYVSKKVYMEEWEEMVDEMDVVSKDSMEWLKVKVAGNRVGYVAMQYVPLGISTIRIEQQKGRWFITLMDDTSMNVCTL
jgi:hypothetical protein